MLVGRGNNRPSEKPEKSKPTMLKQFVQRLTAELGRVVLGRVIPCVLFTTQMGICEA